MKEFPNDDDGDVLRGLQKRGVDLEKPRIIEFCCYAKSMHVAQIIVDRLDHLGFKSEIFEDDESSDESRKFSVYSARQMIPEYKEIIRIQAELNSILPEYDTYCDGWGTPVEPEETNME